MSLNDAYLEVNLKQQQIAAELSLGCNNTTVLAKAQTLVDRLVYSKAARIVAVHRIITNKGIRSLGVSKYNPKTNQDYVNLVEALKEVAKKPQHYKASPLNRVYIKKKDDFDINSIPLSVPLVGDPYASVKELRPISVPTIFDRCVQALWYLALEPLIETHSDPNSFGFRKGRSPAWAIHLLAISLRGNFNPTWVIEVDIAKCFDTINHNWLMNNIPLLNKHILNQWLKQGYVIPALRQLGLLPTVAGVPQGGIVSPAICNFTLDGMETYIRQGIKQDIISGVIDPKEVGYTYLRLSGTQESKLILPIRFADDMVILAKSLPVAERAKYHLQQFLSERGLALSETKTKLTNLEAPKASFDFLGFTLLKQTYGKQSKWFVVPCLKNIQSVQRKIKRICHSQNLNLTSIFIQCNSVLRGWLNYYVHTNAKRAFSRMHNWLFVIFWRCLAKRLGKRKNLNRRGMPIRKKIFHFIKTRFLKTMTYSNGNAKMSWFYLKNPDPKQTRKKQLRLTAPAMIKINQDVPKTKSGLNACIPADWEKIVSVNLTYRTGPRRAVLKKYQYCCARCQNSLLDSGLGLEFHHILPVKYGGQTTMKNLVPLCSPCHRVITTAQARLTHEQCEPLIQAGLLRLPSSIKLKQ